MLKRWIIIGAVCAVVAIVTSIATTRASGPSAAYEYGFQEPHGARATFHVSGPATSDSPDVEGDAIVDYVEYPSGEVFHFFYKPTVINDLSYFGDPRRWKIMGGTRTTVGIAGEYPYSDFVGSESDFAQLIRRAFDNNNLNNYVDLSGSAPRFAFTIGFEQFVKDNDPGPDDFGEILYFERGSGSGNSWLKMRALDADGTALGPWLVVSPNETVQTTPITTVMAHNQKMGTTSIDVSRLGVSEFQYLEISNDVIGDSAYTGGGDLAPDFKIMAVITNQAQLDLQGLGAFD